MTVAVGWTVRVTEKGLHPSGRTAGGGNRGIREAGTVGSCWDAVYLLDTCFDFSKCNYRTLVLRQVLGSRQDDNEQVRDYFCSREV